MFDINEEYGTSDINKSTLEVNCDSILDDFWKMWCYNMFSETLYNS